MIYNSSGFIFDNISSSAYGLTIAYLNDSEPNDNKVAEHEYDSYKTKSDELKILDIKDSGTREFEITLVREKPIELYEIDSIYKWLMPKDTKFRKLFIDSDKYQGYYYKCKITKILSIPVGGYEYAIKCSVLCQSQYAYSNIKKKTYSSPALPLNFTIFNDSSKKITPIFKFKCNSPNGTISLKNNSTNEIMTLNELILDETIVINYEELSIKSDKSPLVLSRFNKQFLSFKSGLNNLTLSGNVSEFEYSYQNAKVFVH